MAGIDDHFASIPVPANARRGPVTMGLLWMTMVTCFPTVLIGFEWYKGGITLTQVLVCTVIACAILTAYTLPTVHLAAKTGKSYSMLNREVFGSRGAIAINCILIGMFVLFYGLAALLLAEGVNSLFGAKLPLAWVACGLAVLMALNNFFGFSGVANFARYVAAPVLIIWVGYTFGKAANACPVTVLTQAPTQSFGYALTAVSSFVIGFAIWGNESDYWRYGKPRIKYALIPFVFALLIGMIIFPVAGWMVAKISGITDYGAATNFMSNYSFGGMPWLGAIVLTASFFACNDSNLFGSGAAFQSMTKISHKKTVAILAVAGAFAAYLMAAVGGAKSIEIMASYNCVLLPTPTVVVAASFFMAKLFEDRGFLAGPSHVCATVSILAGVAVGLLTTGQIPGTEALKFGIPCLQAWGTALVVFVSLRSLQYRRASDFAIAMPIANEGMVLQGAQRSESL